MKTKLTDEDIKSLKYEMRSGLLFSLFVQVIALILILYFRIDKNYDTAIILFVLSLIISFGIYFIFNEKYIADISGKEKKLTEKIIEEKFIKQDREAGSGKPAGKMKSLKLYVFVIDGIRYKVKKELYEKCLAGDKVIFHTAPKSRHLLKIEKANKKNPA